MASAARYACDSSVSIPAIDESHDDHEPCLQAVLTHRPSLAGHAVFESYAVLTRLRIPLVPAEAAALLSEAFPERSFLDVEDQRALVDRFPSLGLAGGTVYDALVGEAARIDGRVLLTRDRRAERTYRAVGTEYELVG